MRAMTRAAGAVIVFAIAFAAVTAAATSIPPTQDPAPAPAAAQDRFPETPGKAALLKVCSNCHTVESLIQSLRTRQEWSDVVDQMARFGAEASDQEFDQILAYLVRHFSPIRINTATAKDLEATLDVTAAAAAAIVAYRTGNGDFKTFDDLKKVPGIDAVKIDSQKTRVVF
jgi:competence protein ComEA